MELSETTGETAALAVPATENAAPFITVRFNVPLETVVVMESVPAMVKEVVPAVSFKTRLDPPEMLPLNTMLPLPDDVVDPTVSVLLVSMVTGALMVSVPPLLTSKV